MIKIEKKKYEVPSMRVLELKRKAHLLAGSNSGEGEGSAGGSNPSSGGLDD